MRSGGKDRVSASGHKIEGSSVKKSLKMSKIKDNHLILLMTLAKRCV